MADRVLPRYPVYVISKGRWGREGLTTRFLGRDGVPHRVVVEPQEADAYAAELGRDRLEVLPFSNLGLGSIPARNWVWEHALAGGHARHWILDDNISLIYRRWRSVRVPCEAGPALAAVEDFVDRYENLAVAGLNYAMFAPDRAKMPPFVLNCHVYSCLLIDCSIPFRWRGRYNEDADLCLQALAGGWCTALKRRFGRPQHYVDWKRFKTELRRRPGVVVPEGVDEYGMLVRQVGEVRSAYVRELTGLGGGGDRG